MMRRQDGESAPTRAAVRNQHTSSLGDEGIALADTCIARFEIRYSVWLIGSAYRKRERRCCKVSEITGVDANRFPAFAVAQLDQALSEICFVRDLLEVGLEVGRVAGKQCKALLKGLSDRRQP